MNVDREHDAALTVVQTAQLTINHEAPRARLSLRIREQHDALAERLSCEIPRTIGMRTTSERMEMLCLGPDEWMIHLKDPSDAAETMQMSQSCRAEIPHSLVDVSARELGYVLEGSHAAELLRFGMARDPEGIPIGEGRRTQFDGATCTLWRDQETRYRIDFWRSFAPFALSLIQSASKELASDAAHH